jgi:hypothetical protein
MEKFRRGSGQFPYNRLAEPMTSISFKIADAMKSLGFSPALGDEGLTNHSDLRKIPRSSGKYPQGLCQQEPEIMQSKSYRNWLAWRPRKPWKRKKEEPAREV